MCGVRGEHKELAGTCLPITAINQLDLFAPLTPPQVVVGLAEDKEDKGVAKEEMAKNMENKFLSETITTGISQLWVLHCECATFFSSYGSLSLIKSEECEALLTWKCANSSHPC